MNLAEHWPYILEVSKQRLSNNKTERHISKYGTQIEVRGAAAELAARLYLGLEPELHTHFDGGHDFYFAGKAVDVKASRLIRSLQFRNLQWPEWKEVKADVILFVAVHLTQMRAVMVGYATKNEILAAPVNSMRHQPCHEIPIPMLHPVWELTAEQSFIDWNRGGRVEEERNPI